MELKEGFLKDLKIKGYAPTTIFQINLYLDYFKQYLTLYSIKDITPKTINEYKNSLYHHRKKNGKPLHPSSVFARLNALRRYFQFLKREKYIFYDPTIKLELPRMKEHLPRNILTEKEVLNLLSQPDIKTSIGLRDRAILEVLYSSGLRRRELISLNLYDIDFNKGILRVVKGKGGKDRTIPVGKAACEFVNQYIRQARSRWIKKISEKALFITMEGRRMTPGDLGYTIWKYSQRIGRPITCHSLRHSCATHMLRGGADLRVIQAILGHSSQNSTQIYTRVVPVDLKKMLKRCHPRERMKKN